MRAFNLKNQKGNPYLTAQDTAVNFTGDVKVGGKNVATSSDIDTLEEKIQGIKSTSFETASSLDDITSPKENVIYLIPKASSKTKNVKDEYIWVNGAWELIGNTEVDVSSKQDKLNFYSENGDSIILNPTASVYIDGPLKVNEAYINNAINTELLVANTLKVDDASIFAQGPLIANNGITIGQYNDQIKIDGASFALCGNT